VTFKFINLLQAFSNVIFHTSVQQATRFQVTARRMVPLQHIMSFLSNPADHMWYHNKLFLIDRACFK